MRLTTGAELRVTGPSGATAAVVCVNGGQAAEVEGTWSATIEWLVRRLAPQFPALAFAEVRYRIKSWNKLDWCVEDARAAVAQTGAQRTLLLAFSMGGAVSARIADDPTVETVLGLAPWLPPEVSLQALRGKRLRVRTVSATCSDTSTARCRGSRASHRRSRAPVSSGRWRSEPPASTR